MPKKPKSQVVMVTDSCGCVFCDLDLPRVKQTLGKGWGHSTKRGTVPCTRK